MGSASDLGGLIGMPAPSDPYDAADVAALTLAGYPDAAVEQARAACASFVISTELADACALDVLVTGDTSFANSYAAVSEYERPTVSGVDVKGPSGSSNPFVPIVGGGGDDEDSNTGQIIFFVVLAVVLAICVGYAAFVALSRRKKKQALSAAAADVEAQVKSKASDAEDKVKGVAAKVGAEDKVDAVKEEVEDKVEDVEDKVEEVKAVVRKERKRKRRQAVKNAVEEVVEVEAVKVNVAGKAEAVKDVVDDVVGMMELGLSTWMPGLWRPRDLRREWRMD